MINQKNDSHNFWSGYALGMLAGSVLMYTFGTKNGRSTVKKVMDHTDTLEHSIEDILHLIQSNLLKPDEDDTNKKK